MKNYTIGLKANTTITIGGLKANYVRVIDGSAVFSLTPNKLDPIEVMQKGLSFRASKEFTELTLLSDVDQTIVLTVGYGDISDDRLNISGSIDASSNGTTITNTAHTVGTSAAELLAADSTRRSVLIKNMDTTNSIFVGADNTVTTANGFEIEAGQAIAMDKAPQAAIHAIGAAASIDVRTLQESN